MYARRFIRLLDATTFENMGRESIEAPAERPSLPSIGSGSRRLIEVCKSKGRRYRRAEHSFVVACGHAKQPRRRHSAAPWSSSFEVSGACI